MNIRVLKLVPVRFQNSTVLGYKDRDLWRHLLWNRSRSIWRDPSARVLGCGGYDYLHVPAWNPLDKPVPKESKDLCHYRVRPRMTGWGGTVLRIDAVKVGARWHWNVEIEKRKGGK